MFVKQIRLILPLVLVLYSCSKEREGWDKYVHASDVLDSQEKITAELPANAKITTPTKATIPNLIIFPASGGGASPSCFSALYITYLDLFFVN